MKFSIFTVEAIIIAASTVKFKRGKSMLLVTGEQIKEYTNKGYWGNESIIDLVYKSAREFPEEEALVDPYNRKDLVGREAKRFTYAQVIKAVDRLAIKFVELGIQKDDIIAVQLPNVVELILIFLAAARIGAIITPLGVQYRTHELEHALKMCDPVAYVATTKFKNFNNIEMIKSLIPKYPKLKIILGVGVDEEISNGVLNFEEIISTPFEEKYGEDYLRGRQSDPNEVFSICWTSGTEAEPKGVPRSHNQWIAIGALVPITCELPPRCTILASFPLINMAGIGSAFVLWVVNGGKLVLHHPFDQVTYFKQISREKVAYTMVPPALLNMFDELPQWAGLDKSSLKVLTTGGSFIPPWIVRKYRDVYKINIVCKFASNEGLSMTSSCLFFSDPEDRAIYFPRWGVEGIDWKGIEDIPDEFGRRMMHSTQTKLVNPQTGKIITEKGIAGELRCKGPTVFAGYWKRPDLTANAFDEEGYYRTGDLFSIEGDKKDKYLFKGRYKELIIRGGQNISPVEIENLVSSHPKIFEVAVVGYADERLGEKVCVVVVPRPGETITLEEINNYLQEKDIAIYKYPQRLEIIDIMPRNALNKIDKKKLRESLART